MEFIYLNIQTGANGSYGVDQTYNKGLGVVNSVRIVGICSKGVRDQMIPLVNNVAVQAIQQNNTSLQLSYNGLNNMMVLPAPVGEFMMKQLENKTQKVLP